MSLFHTDFGSIFSNDLTIASQYDLLFVAYFTTCIIASIKLLKKAENLNASQLCAFILLPRHLGGLAVIPFSTFSMHGPLTQAIHLCPTVALKDEKAWVEVSKLIRFHTATDLKGLVLDPYSIPVDTPIQPARYLTDMVKISLPEIVKHRM